MIKDGLKYPFSDVKMIFILGVVLLAAELINKVPIDGMGVIHCLILITTILIAVIVELGYVFKVIKETINGSDKLPKFNHLRAIFVHGIEEIIVSTIYLLLPFLLFALSFLLLFSGYYSDLMWRVSLGYVFLISGLILTFISTFILQIVVMNMAHHHGSIKSGFNFKKIQGKIRIIGFKRLILAYIITTITVGSLVLFLSDLIKSIPLGLLISEVIIAPYLLLFTARILGLLDRESP